MKSEFLLAITQLAAEKKLSKEVVLDAVEAALVSAYRKDSFVLNQNISAKIDPVNGKVRVWAEKAVVQEPRDMRCEISLAEACKIKPEVEIGDAVLVEATPRDAGRIAAQTAKQVILQRLHEAEYRAIYDEYAGKEGDIVSGVVRRIEPRQIFIDFGRAEAVMPQFEQAPNERYRVGQRLKVYLLDVAQSERGPLLVVSRSHSGLLRRLFEQEVPEIYNGTVEIKAVAREAGYRSKVAVAARQDGIDPVGCCVGLRGIRIQNIASELNGEKIDVINWSPEPAVFIAKALSPARVVGVELRQAEEETATVVIPDKQLSLAIGKEGQNVRLAVKLSGWRIDIISVSKAEAKKAEAAEAGEATAVGEGLAEEALEIMEPSLVSVEAAIPGVAPETTKKQQVRFAEDILPPSLPKSSDPSKKKKKKKKATRGKDRAENGIKLRKQHRGLEIDEDEKDEYY